MHPLVRWQFRGGIAEKDRKAFLFTNVTTPRAASTTSRCWSAGSPRTARSIASALGCPLDKIDETLGHAPRPTRSSRNVVENAPCHEIVITGADLLTGRATASTASRVPISTPGWDIAPYTTLSQYITKDPDTGVQNMGNYRGQVKARTAARHEPVAGAAAGHLHALAEVQEDAASRSCPPPWCSARRPCVTFASVQKLPEHVDELHVAGALVGAPINVVKAKTVDLLVPAEAEIVIEGFIDTEYLEPEAPFGESHGHVNLQEFNAFMDVTCITRRKDAILTSIISQVTPSESSLIKRVGMEPLFLNCLRNTLGHQGRQARVDARAADQHPQGHRARHASATCRRRRCGARSTAPSGCTARRQVRDRASTTTSIRRTWTRCCGRCRYRANPELDMQILPHRDQGHGPRSQRNGGAGRLGADRRDAEGGLPADLAAASASTWSARR